MLWEVRQPLLDEAKQSPNTRQLLSWQTRKYPLTLVIDMQLLTTRSWLLMERRS